MIHSSLRKTAILPGKDRRQIAHEEKIMREDKTEKEIDKMIEDSFPASDPPSTY